MHTLMKTLSCSQPHLLQFKYTKGHNSVLHGGSE